MSDVAAIHNLVQKREVLKNEIAKIIVGQESVIDQILLSIFSGGHALLVGVPGLAKTLMVNTISEALGLDFKRIQFTPLHNLHLTNLTCLFFHTNKSIPYKKYSLTFCLLF